MQANETDQTTELVTYEQKDIEEFYAFGVVMKIDSIIEDYKDGFLTNAEVVQFCIEKIAEYQTEMTRDW